MSAADVLAWLLTYAIHSTIVLSIAALVAWRLADHHAWLDAIWKTALIGPLVTASLALGPRVPIAPVMPLTQSSESFPRADTPGERVASEEAPRDPAAQAAPVAQEPAQAIPWRPPRMPSWSLLAVLTWISIAAVVLVRYGASLVRLYRTIRSGTPVTDPRLLEALDALRTGSGSARAITVTTSDVCAVPVALAGRHIVLPRQFADALDADQQRAALAHEVAHVSRHDPAWRIAGAIVERVFFFQPLNRTARVRMTESAEFICDQWAVRHTGAPLALARCLSTVASWASPANDRWAIGVSAMARSDSAMVRRVTHILNEPAALAQRPRLLWLAVALAVVTVAAPRMAAHATVQARISGTTPRPAATAAEIAKAQARLRVHRPPRPNDSLEARWNWALADARRQRFSDFWIAYSFETPVHAEDLVMSDSDGNSFVSSDGRMEESGPPLIDVLRDGGGNIVVLLHYRGNGADAIDRVAYRSAKLGFDFGRTPLFWLGFADESQSFDRARSLFEQARREPIRVSLLELASIHGNSNLVIPFLTRLVDASQPPAIRNEATEGFGNHHEARSIEVLLRVARTDPLSDVRAEAAETIGEVQTPQSIPALNTLVDDSDDPEVRREAAEAFADQPVDQALAALERLIAANREDEVLGEAIEALGELEGAGVLELLVQTVNAHPNRHAQREAVETVGDIEDVATVDVLARIIHEHPDPLIRAEAIETIADAVSDSTNAPSLDRVEQVLERAIFDDPDTSVQMEALDGLEELPRDRQLRLLQQVIDRHPDNRMRREAGEHLRERRQ